MKNSVFVMLMVTVLVISFAGCGKQAVEDVFADAKTTVNSKETDETDETESSEAVLPETSVSMRGETAAEELDGDVSYRETESLYLIEGVYNDGKMYDTSALERVSETYDLTQNVDVYWLDMDLAGYTKDGVSVYVISSNDEWSYCIFDRTGYLIKTDELMDAMAKPIVAEATPSAPVTETPKPESTPVESEPVVDIPVVEEPVVEESDKYTPEEAIAVWKSILDANGMIYDPSIKEFASWGTGFMFLDKGYPEQAAQMDLEGMAYGDGAGNSNTRYYFEVTGSDENCVYTIAWACD